MNTEKTKYMFIFHHQNIGQNLSLLTAHKLFENVMKFQCFRKTVTHKTASTKKLRIY